MTQYDYNMTECNSLLGEDGSKRTGGNQSVEKGTAN